VQSSAAAAFRDYVANRGLGWQTPPDGYELAREEPRRALITYDVEDRVKVAVVVADGTRGLEDSEGWGVLAWAQCDPSELPMTVTDALNVGVWQAASGRRLPVTRVRSFQGAEHCDWTQLTFLLIGPDERTADWYVRDPAPERSGLAEYLHGGFEPQSALPEDARDTGWSRDGRRLWLGPEAAFLVAADDPADVERWPATREPIWCA
jgi:hypothetical protein